MIQSSDYVVFSLLHIYQCFPRHPLMIQRSECLIVFPIGLKTYTCTLKTHNFNCNENPEMLHTVIPQSIFPASFYNRPNVFCFLKAHAVLPTWAWQCSTMRVGTHSTCLQAVVLEQNVTWRQNFLTTRNPRLSTNSKRSIFTPWDWFFGRLQGDVPSQVWKWSYILS